MLSVFRVFHHLFDLNITIRTGVRALEALRFFFVIFSLVFAICYVRVAFVI